MRNQLMPFQGARLIFTAVIMICSLIILVFRLYEWQVVRYSEFAAGARDNAEQSVPLPAPRGVIYDRFNNKLALNVPAFSVTIIPANLPDDENATLDVLNRLSALIDVPPTRAAADAAGKKNIRSLQEMVIEGQGIAPYREVVVKTDIDQSIAESILQDVQSLPGVQLRWDAVRQYPTGSLTSQIVGYLGPIGSDEAEKLRKQGYNPSFERVGYSGVEAYLDDDLSGTRGLLTQEVDVAGLPVKTIQRDEPVAGKNVRLTLDLELQKGAQKALITQMNKINVAASRAVTQSGVVIALNPKTGEVLAMVSWPTYDNTNFARAIDAEYYLRTLEAPFKPFTNHAISDQYPPGSVWKVITATGVAQERVIDPHATLYDSGELFVENVFAKNDVASRQRFVCWLRAGHKDVDLVHGIAWSCDVYFYQVGGGNTDPKVANVLRPGGLGIDDMNRYAAMFGFGSRLGIELPGEEASRMPDRDWKRRNYGESWSTGDTYNAAFGQGYVLVTPLQLVNAAAAIANGGTLYQPTLVNSWVDPDGNVLQTFKPTIERTLVLPSDSSPAVLNLHEDMILRGKDSIACTCDPSSPYRDKTNRLYDPKMPECAGDLLKNYQATVHTPDHGDVPYTVNVPYGYNFRGACNTFLFNKDYVPPFVTPENLGYVQQGMRGATTIEGGTALRIQNDLGYTQVAGKTGTAEYCDNIASAQGLCLPGSWPSHAWFVGYAPYNNPEIIAIAFLYNAGEGSANALPVVDDVLGCYFTLKNQRSQTGGNGAVSPCEPSATAK